MTTTPPSNFVKRDWDKPEYDDTAPRDRFEVYEGPESGGVESAWQPGWGLTIDLPELGSSGHGLDMTIDEAKKLRDDLLAVLAQIEV